MRTACTLVAALVWAATSTIIVLPPSVVAVSVWPQPTNATYGSDARPLDPASFTIQLPEQWVQDEDMQAAVQRTLERIRGASIAPYTVDHGEAQAAKAQANAAKPLRTLQVRLACSNNYKRVEVPFSSHSSHSSSGGACGTATSNSSESKRLETLSVAPLEQHDEHYKLHVALDDGPAVLLANNALGALRGLATFSQLVYTTLKRSTSPTMTFIDGLPLAIDDRAAFKYRGLMIDTSRNYLPPSTIKRQLDAMELLKLNQLHWHITDTASWPLGLTTKGMEVLAQRGAYADGGIYDRAVVQDIVHYAAQRGINIIMEIDMPGHQYMGVKDYPGELITCNTEEPSISWTTVANEPPGGHLDIRKPAATQLMKDIFSELTAYLPGPYVSTGNDEVEAQCYGLERGDTNGTDVILAPFVDAVHSHLVSLGKTPVVWEEAALDYPLTASKLKNGTLVEAWTTSDNVERILRSNENIRVVHAPTDYFYLDCGMGGWLGNYVNGQSYCAFVTWQKQYSFDPLNGTQAVEGGAARIAGGESAMWAEQTDAANIEPHIWPRAAAGAEVFWTGAKYSLNGQQSERNVSTALPRLHEMRGRLRALGINASPLQPAWCALRPGRCDLPA